MSLSDEIRALCSSLAERGWDTVLRPHGINLRAQDIDVELAKRVRADRSRAGFRDLCLDAVRGVEPGDPARSILYHTLAHPGVHPGADGVHAEDAAYPTVAELDLIENYVYSRSRSEVLPSDCVIGVFAYEYRPAASTPHGYHADLVFSRTGIARVGDGDAAWHGPWRSFRPDPPGRRDIAVCPARYAAFMALPVQPEAADPIMGRRDEQDDRLRTFYYPIRKLFPGDECLDGAMLEIAFTEFHRNEKLRKVHRVGGISVTPGFDVDSLPFVRDSTNGGELVDVEAKGASILIVPRTHPSLVRTVNQRNAATGRDELVRFLVPPAVTRGPLANRFFTSLTIPAVDAARLAPEYLNIRHRVVEEAGALNVEDLQLLPDEQFRDALRDGGYEAAHFTDNTADGAVTVRVRGMPTALPSLPAYSLVAAPDFFPVADQLEISTWVRDNLQNLQEHFAQGAPWPLCEGRRPANLDLPRPDVLGERAFRRGDETVTAIVAAKPRSTGKRFPVRQRRFSSSLPDAAANEFEPGWDVSLTRDEAGLFLSSLGLGSPFPEDAKLCAALNSFWPAVAPDASRTFNFQGSPTAMPLLDDEIGFHPNHPDVLTGRAVSARGWDGEYGPFEETIGGATWINAASIDRSDYVTNALANHFDIRKTSHVDSQEFIARMEALRSCIRVLPPKKDMVSTTKLWLSSAIAVPDWATAAERADDRFQGQGYVYVFVNVDKKPEAVPEDPTRVRWRVKRRFCCQISEDWVAFRQGAGAWCSVRRERAD